jgi:hypothetical protein
MAGIPIRFGDGSADQEGELKRIARREVYHADAAAVTAISPA